MSHDVMIDATVLPFVPKSFDGLILDVGCGWGWFGFRIRIAREVRGFLIGIDAFAPYTKKLKKLKIYDELVVADSRFLPFRSNIVNIIFATEVIEHLPKEEGFILLNECERISQGRIIVTTPRGFMPQEPFEANIFSPHRSGWIETDFTKRGYEVMLVGRPKLFLRPMPPVITYYTTSLVELLPRIIKKSIPKEYIIAFKKVG